MADTITAKFAMPDRIHNLGQQIMGNCHRSDARFAGSFSLCGLLLRLRDYYRWEHGMAPWEEFDNTAILNWIEKREELWETRLEDELSPLCWNGDEIDPFDARTVNRHLEGYHYSAGYAAFLKPSFVLAKIDRQEQHGSFTIIYLGEELARDLFTSPAQTRETVIVARRRPLAAYLWDMILHGPPSRRQALDQGLIRYGLGCGRHNPRDRNWIAGFESLLNIEMESHVRHELGEATDLVFPRKDWQTIIGRFPQTRIELMARSLKDLLGDTGPQGRLKFIVDQRRMASLDIYVAEMEGLRALIFPELDEAYHRFLKDPNWDIIESVRETAYIKVTRMARFVVGLMQGSGHTPEHFTEQIETHLYQPLGL
jgi:hypothetical protein